MCFKMFLWLSTLLWYAEGDRRLGFFGKKVVCTYNKDFFYNITFCNIKMVNRVKQVYSACISFKPVIISNFRVRMKTYYKFRTEYRPIGVNADEDACIYLNFINGNKVFTIETFINIPKDISGITCPIKGPMNFTIQGLEINPFRLPPFAPVGDWHFDSISYTIIDGKEIFLLNVQNYFEVRYMYD